MEERKSEEIHLRMTPTEKKEIEEKAKLADKSVANYLISLSQNQRIVVAKKLPTLIYEINKIGVNVNQITAVANSQKYVSKEMLIKVREELQKVVDLLQQILEEVYNTDEHTFQSLENKIDKLTAAVEGLMNNGNGQGD